MVVRGCGTRTYGGVYLEVKLAKDGEPGTNPRKFLVDPVREVPDGMGIPNRGVALIPRPDGSGVMDVWDHVGTNNYRCVEDFWREILAHGVSRKISSRTDFSQLTPESRLILIHQKAMLLNADELYRAIDVEIREMVDANHWRCMCGKPDHDGYPVYARDSQDMMSTCVSSWAEVVEGGEEIYEPGVAPRTVKRTIGDTTYQGRHTPLDFTPEYVEGIFAIFPITCLAVINDPQDGKHIPNMQRAEGSSLKVVLEDE